MNRRKKLGQFIRRAKRSLNIEHGIPKLQYGILIGLVLYAAILVVSRLFVFPHYRSIAIYAGLGVLVITVIYIWWTRIKEKGALHRLDAYYPHNELVTALSFKEETPLVNSLMEKAVEKSSESYERFKRRKKALWLPKVLMGMVFGLLVIGVLSAFPSATQQEANDIEKEEKIIKDLEKEVADYKKKTKSEKVKKELQQLQNKLKEVESSEEALREVVKKQKELKLQEQKLKEKEALAENGDGDGKGLTSEEQKQLDELAQLQQELAKSASSTQTALSKMGKQISFDLQNAIASELGSESNDDNGKENGSSNDDKDGSKNNNENNQQGNNQGNGNDENQGTGNGNKDGQNEGTGEGTGQGQGDDSSQGNGNGQGNGKGTGTGSGQGGKGSGQGSSQGSGAGKGQGSRDLLSIPERIGGDSGTTVDGGPLSKGNAIGEQKGSVPVTKGTIRPYEEVIGEYKDSYLESSKRMQLPKDLQSIVQSYFSSMESN